MADDYASDTTTTGVLFTGGTASGVLEASYDSDWFKIAVQAGYTYQFTLSPAESGGYLPQNAPGMQVYAASTYSVNTTSIVYGTNPVIWFKPVTSGDYYLSVGSYYYDSGAYSVKADLLGTDDYGDTANGATSLGLGATVKGKLELGGDIDVFSIVLEAGKTYTLAAAGLAAANGTVALPVAGFYTTSSYYSDTGTLYRAAGTANDLATASFTPTTSGTYYATVNDINKVRGTGAYQLTLAEAADDYGAYAGAAGKLEIGGGAVKGVIDVAADVDWFKVTLQANQAYLFSLDEGGNHTALSIVDAQGASLASYGQTISGSGQMLSWTAPRAGDYYVQVATTNGSYYTAKAWTGSYGVRAQALQADDFSASTATKGVLSVGQTLKGSIETFDDVDWIKVKLDTGVTYNFGLSAATLADGTQKQLSSFSLLNSSGQSLTYQYGGSGAKDIGLSYTPSSGGDYYLRVDGTSTPLSTYSVTWYRPVADDIAGDTGTKGTLAEGGVVRGKIDAPTDRDWYKVELAANKSYNFAVDGAASQGGTLGADGGTPVLKLYDAAGKSVTFSYSFYDSSLYTYGQSAGTYYIEVASSSFGTGSYTLKEALNGVMPDTRAPLVTSLSGPTAQNGLEANIVLSFNEGVLLDSGTIKLSTAAGKLVESFNAATSVRLSSSGSQLTIDPSARLSPDTDYVLELGVGSVKDSLGNSTVSAMTQAFHTKAGMQNLEGGGGNDVFVGGSGGGVYHGAGGIDTLVLSSSSYSYSIRQNALNTTVSRQDETHTLYDVERVQFSDATTAFDLSGNAGQVYRLYQAAFNRTPDIGGLGYWIGQADKGVSLHDVANGFVTSGEFAKLYGATQTDTAFVTSLYQNVLHRAPDSGGLDYWTGQLGHGLAKADVLTAFSESAENQIAVYGSIQSGISYTPFL